MEYFKFGFCFYVGYEVAKKLNEVLGVVYPKVKEHIKKGY